MGKVFYAAVLVLVGELTQVKANLPGHILHMYRRKFVSASVLLLLSYLYQHVIFVGLGATQFVFSDFSASIIFPLAAPTVEADRIPVYRTRRGEEGGGQPLRDSGILVLSMFCEIIL